MRKILILASLVLSTSAFASSASRACNNIGLPFESDIDRCMAAGASTATIKACGYAGFVQPKKFLSVLKVKQVQNISKNVLSLATITIEKFLDVLKTN